MPPLPALLTPRLRPGAAPRRFAAWLALFALLVGTLVPTLSRLAQPEGVDALGALCQARAGTPDGPAGSHALGDACALCTLAHTTPVLAGGAVAVVAAIAYAAPVPVAAPAVRERVVQARAPEARGPPVAG